MLLTAKRFWADSDPPRPEDFSKFSVLVMLLPTAGQGHAELPSGNRGTEQSGAELGVLLRFGEMEKKSAMSLSAEASLVGHALL